MTRRRPEPRVIRSPRDAEAAARDWMRYLGFADARMTVVGPDMGIDVTASGAVAQVKAGASPTGRPVVQQIFGAAELESKDAFLFAVGGVTDEAREWADRAGVALFRLDLAGDAFSLNAVAKRVLGGADRAAAGWSAVQRAVEEMVVSGELGALIGECIDSDGEKRRWGIWHMGRGRIESAVEPSGSDMRQESSVSAAVDRVAGFVGRLGISARDCDLVLTTLAGSEPIGWSKEVEQLRPGNNSAPLT